MLFAPRNEARKVFFDPEGSDSSECLEPCIFRAPSFGFCLSRDVENIYICAADRFCHSRTPRVYVPFVPRRSERGRRGVQIRGKRLLSYPALGRGVVAACVVLAKETAHPLFTLSKITRREVD